MAGFGTMPAGTGPFGLGTPLTASAPPSGASGSRYINPATRDYEQDPDSLQLKQMPATRQRVLLALMTARGSSTALRTFGVRIPKKITTTFKAEVQASVRTALLHLTDTEPVIRIDTIIVETGTGGRVRITVSYTDLLANQRDGVTV